MKCKLVLILLIVATTSFAQTNTWSDNVASIFYSKCSSCHHQGAIGPFNLMSYSDAVAAASGVYDAISDNRMPPWPPDTTYKKFAHQRTLNLQQKNAVLDWINNGLPASNLSNAPAPPVFPIGSAVNETPDLVAPMPVFTNYSNSDIYQCFVVPSGLQAAKYIRGFEVIPGNRQVVHHVLVYADTTGVCANLDAQDPHTGYLSFGGVGTNSAELIGLWVPGADPQFYPTGMGLRLPANADIVIQVHYPGSTIGLQDSTKVNFFFSNAPTIRRLQVVPILNHSTSLTNGPLFIGANQTKTFNGEFHVPAVYGKISLLQVAPHMHLIGRSIKSWAISPSNVTMPLINIPSWDFKWQGGYDFQQIEVMPAGSSLYFEAFYDNTLNNPFNPFNPPINVAAGEATTDEMMMVYFTFTAYQPGDENLIIDSSLVTQIKIPTDNKNEISLYPNPINNNEVTLNAASIAGQDLEVKLMDVSGRLIYSAKIKASISANQIDLPNLTNGIYLMQISTNQKNYSFKLNKTN